MEDGGISAQRAQTIVGASVLLVAAGMGFGALQITGEAGYGGVGPNFLPWVCAVALAICGAWLVWEAPRAASSEAEGQGQHAKADISAFVWVSAGLLINAALIGIVGFVLSCAICYVLAVQGLRRASGQAQAGAPGIWIKDVVTGVALSAPVFWIFTKLLAINLPSLTSTGWL